MIYPHRCTASFTDPSSLHFFRGRRRSLRSTKEKRKSITYMHVVSPWILERYDREPPYTRVLVAASSSNEYSTQVFYPAWQGSTSQLLQHHELITHLN